MNIDLENDMKILNQLFNQNDHLLSQELDYGNYLIFDKHCIDSVSFAIYL